MQINKSAAAMALTAVVGAATMAGVASAQTSNGTLVDKIAARFNVNKADVQKVFDEDRTAHQIDRQQKYEARLTQAVTDKKLTEAQKTKLLARHKEFQAAMQSKRESMQADRTSMENKTDAERQALRDQRKTEMDKQRADIEAWEKANNIPSGYLFDGNKGDGMGGRQHFK